MKNFRGSECPEMSGEKTRFLNILLTYDRCGLPWNKITDLCIAERICIEDACSLLTTPGALLIRDGRIVHPKFA